MAGPIRVALTTDPARHGVSSVVAQGVRLAANLLDGAGYDIQEVDPPSIDESTQVIQLISDMEIESYLPEMRSMMSEEGVTVLERIIGDTAPDLPAYMKAIAKRHRIAEQWNRFFERTPLVLGPVSTLEPFEIGYDVAGPRELKRFIRSIGLTEACNLLGLPSIAVPVQVVDGLPQGVQLIGPRYHEDLCFDAAEIIERRQGVFTPIDPRDMPDQA